MSVRGILAWPAMMLLYWSGHIVSMVLNNLPDTDDDPGPVFNAFFRYYQWSMPASAAVNDWGGLSFWSKPIERP